MMKFRTELWRIVKFLLITFAVNLVFSLINTGITTTLLANRSSSTGMWLSVLSWGFTLCTTLAATLLHRYFTFRATEPWYIAVPFMLVAAIIWQLVKSFPLNAAGNAGPQTIITMTYLLSFGWMILSYLLQRCVIYCHTTDTNGWYRRFHPTNDE
ncbi:MAG: hypothetical protein IJD99_04745 [Clostridia bacterium]|nr:hypothetical protein [Clostridia bacterium]